VWNRFLYLFFVGLALSAAQSSNGGALERGLQAFSEGRFSEAEASLREAVASQPKSFEARFALGATFGELKRPAEAIAQLQVAHRLRPEHPDALKLLAAQYIAAREYSKALALLSEVRARDEEVYLLLIESWQSSGDAGKSFATAQEAVARFPASARMNCWMGFQLQFSGRYDDARRYLEKAIQLDAGYPAGYYLLGQVLLKQQKARESIAWFEKTIDLDPEDIDARMALSQALADAGDLAKALDVLQSAEKSAPRDPRVHLLLSRLWFRLGNEANAREEANLSLQYRTDEPATAAVPAALRQDQ
jgi:tetratricopeptide (TPR) repeat protein